MAKTRLTFRIPAIGLPLALLLACAGDDKPASTGEPPPVSCPPGQTWNGQACASPAPATTSTNTSPTSPAAPPSATAPGSAQPLDPALATAVTSLIGAVAAQHIPPGAQPAGAPIAASFATAQSLESPLSMQPGKCYTVVAVGAPTVQNLDVQLKPAVAIPGVPSPVVAQDQTVGSTAVLGESPSCFKWALPVAGTMTMVLTVAQGEGLAAAQVYEK